MAGNNRFMIAKIPVLNFIHHNIAERIELLAASRLRNAAPAVKIAEIAVVCDGI